MDYAKTILEAVMEHAVQMPDKPAVCFKDERLSYRQLLERVETAAFLLRGTYEVRKRDYVMVSALSKPGFVVFLLAIQYLGAVAVPVDKTSTGDHLCQLCRFMEPKVFITDNRLDDPSVRKASFADLYQRVCSSRGHGYAGYEHPDMEDIAEVIFTTGTSGDPKGAMLSYGALRKGAEYTLDGVHRTENDVELIPLPLNHSFGLRVLRAMLYAGGTVVLQNGFMFLKETRRNIEEFGCTGIAVVPALIERLYNSLGTEFGQVFGTLHHMEISAGSLSLDMKQKLLQLIPEVQIFNVWGSSESGGVIFLDVAAHKEHLGSLGIPAEGAEIKMVDADGRFIHADSPDHAGRMILRGKMLMSGYFKRDDLTAETLSEGYLYTNDLAYMSTDGFVYMLGRTDDIINAGGEKVAPVEVENAASQHPSVAVCACIGGEDRDGGSGQVLVLYVVPAAGEMNEKEIAAFLSGKLEQYKVPRHYVEVNELPRNAMHKIDRKKLRQMWAGSLDEIRTNPVVHAIMNRRSIRDFTDRRIPREILETIVTCGCHAPSGHNMQTWRFTVVRDRAAVSRLREAAGQAAKRNHVYFYGFQNPDALILISNDVRNPDGVQDSSCAAQNIMLAAHTYGIGSVWVNVLMKLCGEPEIREILDAYGIPKNHNVWAMLALGYPANRPAVLAKKKDVVRWVEDLQE